MGLGLDVGLGVDPALALQLEQDSVLERGWVSDWALGCWEWGMALGSVLVQDSGWALGLGRHCPGAYCLSKIVGV